MEKKYTIFVSSTLHDLRDEREAVAKAILELGHIPVGMEMFSAADENQWQLIQRQIQECDYYIVIVAHRYGSTVGDISYTEREYDYATQMGVPVLGFVLNESASWPVDRIEKDAAVTTRLKTFKGKVKSKVVSFWSTADQLNMKVITALSKQFVLTPRPGWVRAVHLPGPEVLSEISRLSIENADLRSRVSSEIKPSFEIMFASLTPSDPTGVLRSAKIIALTNYRGSPVYLPKHRCTLSVQRRGALLPFKSKFGSTSSLIKKEGEGLQIAGSGYFEINSTDSVSIEGWDEISKLVLSIRLSGDEIIEEFAEIGSPNWTYGEPGLDIENPMPQ